MRNYFKSKAGKLFFFTDGVPESIEDAYVDAVMLDEDISIYRVATVAGPWDGLSIIGFRTRAEVLRDMAIEEDDEKMECLAVELEAVNECFYSVGRTLPQQVAA